MNPVAIIPARGGSVRIPRKNIKEFHGRTIIAYSIDVAREAGFDVYVSTEDEEIAGVAIKYGAGVIPRPVELADAETGTQAVMRHALEWLGLTEGWAACVYPCAPMLEAHTLRLASWFLGAHDYFIADGIFYFGRVEKFLADVSLEKGFILRKTGERYIDINTDDDWRRAEEMYA